MSIGICRLDELAEIQLGVKTFLNPFFYVDDDRIQRFGIEARFLDPVFRPRDLDRDRFLQDASSTEQHIFLCKATADKLVGTGAAAYIQWAATQRYPPKRGEPGGLWKDTPAATPGKHIWYQNQAMPPPARIVVMKAFNDTFSPLILNQKVRVDQRFNQVNPRPNVDEDVLIGLLASAWFGMTLETYGRTSMGQGALEVPTEALRGLPVPDVRGLGAAAAVEWKSAAKTLVAGPRLPASRLSTNQDQRSLDSLVLEAVGIDAGRLDELYEETVRMGEVRRRLATGRTKMRRERFTTDLADVANDIAQQLKPLLQGRRFPRDFVPAGAATSTLHLGTAPLTVRSDLMLGQRHVVIQSNGTTVFDGHLPDRVGLLLIRALEVGQRTVDLPDEETAADAALIALEQLCKQLNFKLNELSSHAGASHHASLREQAEADLNFPVSRLTEPIAAVYEAEM